MTGWLHPAKSVAVVWVCACARVYTSESNVCYSKSLIAHICGFIDDLSIACFVGLCWCCVCVCKCECVCVLNVGVWSKHEAGLGASVLWWSMAFLQSPVAVELLWRVKCSTDLSLYAVHNTHTHTRTHTHTHTHTRARSWTAAAAQPSLEVPPVAKPAAWHFKELPLCFPSPARARSLTFSGLVFFLRPSVAFFIILLFLLPLFSCLFSCKDVLFTRWNLQGKHLSLCDLLKGHFNENLSVAF